MPAELLERRARSRPRRGRSTRNESPWWPPSAGRLDRRHEEVRAHAVGDEDLRAVDEPAAVDALGARAQRGDVGAGVGLGDRQRADLLAADRRRQVALASAPRCRTSRSAASRSRRARRSRPRARPSRSARAPRRSTASCDVVAALAAVALGVLQPEPALRSAQRCEDRVGEPARRLPLARRAGAARAATKPRIATRAAPRARAVNGGTARHALQPVGAPDHVEHDLVGAGADAVQAHVAPHALDRRTRACSRRRRGSGCTRRRPRTRDPRRRAAWPSRSRAPGTRRWRSARRSCRRAGAPTRSSSPSRRTCGGSPGTGRSARPNALRSMRVLRACGRSTLGARDAARGADQPLALELPHDVVEALADLAEHGRRRARARPGRRAAPCRRRACRASRSFFSRITPGASMSTRNSVKPS